MTTSENTPATQQAAAAAAAADGQPDDLSPRFARALATLLVIAFVSMVAIGVTNVRQVRAEDSELTSASDARRIALQVEVVRTDQRAYPEVVSVDEATQVVYFDGEPVIFDDGDLLLTSTGKSVKTYETSDDTFTLCVVDAHGGWAFYDSTENAVVASGTENQTCAA